LATLRKPGETGYKIPFGGAFNYVSGANYFGEILEWVGFAVASGGASPAVSFAVFTMCNIGPRAFHHHAWYLKTFGEKYPKHRKALIPFIW
jgi:3-oxo-5-alpha-steroid 4-dehydrogenase 1